MTETAQKLPSPFNCKEAVYPSCRDACASTNQRYPPIRRTTHHEHIYHHSSDRVAPSVHLSQRSATCWALWNNFSVSFLLRVLPPFLFALTWGRIFAVTSSHIVCWVCRPPAPSPSHRDYASSALLWLIGVWVLTGSRIEVFILLFAGASCAFATINVGQC